MFDDTFADHGFLQGGGEMGRRIRMHDWSKSPLGPPERWAQSLRSVVSIMLNSKFPMFVAWGPDLAFLYNDGYRPIFGARHPQALGLPFSDVWADIWADVRPLVDKALQGEATFHEDMHLVMERNGYPEDTWYTFSYSPVRDESGGIGGMFCACRETTAEVKHRAAIKEEQQRLRDLFQQAPGFMAVLRGPDHVFEIVNESYLQLIGHRRDVIGRPVKEALPEIEGQGFIELLDRGVKTGETFVGRSMPVTLQRQPGGAVEQRYVDLLYQPIRNDAGAISGIFAEGYDVTERVLAEEKQKLLLRELHHRVKNLFAIAGGMVSLTARTATSPRDMAVALRGRLDALGRANDLIHQDLPETVGRSAEQTRGLDALVRAILLPHMEDIEAATRVRIGGPPLDIGALSVTTLALILHELATNAAKYGALSVPEGRVAVEWSISGDLLDLHWRERGGPMITTPPAAHGFGSALVERSVVGQLHGSLEYDWRAEGLELQLSFPLDRLRN